MAFVALGAVGLRYKDWNKYEHPLAARTALVLVFLFGILMGVNTYRERALSRQEKKNSADIIGGLRKEIKDLRDENHTTAVQTTKSIDALKSETATHGDALEKIGKKQLEVSQQDIALKYDVSIDVIYADKKFQIFNKGNANISLWGTKLGDGPRLIENKPRMISPGGNYYLVGDQWEKDMLTRLKSDDETSGPLQLYLKDGLQREAVLDCMLWVVTKGGAITVHTQNVGVQLRPWQK